MNYIGRLIQKHVASNDIILDLGCGIMQTTTDILYNNSSMKRKIADVLHYKMQYTQKGNLRCKSILGCDIWPNYLKKISYRYPTIKLTMGELDKFVDETYDTVICIDVLEHLKLESAWNAIKEMKRICRKKVIIFTPSKFQTNDDNIENAWDMGHNDHQKHQCYLSPELLKNLDFDVIFPKPSNNSFGVFSKI